MTWKWKDGERQRERDRGEHRARVRTAMNQERDRQEVMVPQGRQLMQHLWQTSGRERRACCCHGGRRCRTSYRHPTASCTPERRQPAAKQTVRQGEKPWGQRCTVLLMYSALNTHTNKHRAHRQIRVNLLFKRCYYSWKVRGARDDRQTGTHQATGGASLASQLADTQDVTHKLLEQPVM